MYNTIYWTLNLSGVAQRALHTWSLYFLNFILHWTNTWLSIDPMLVILGNHSPQESPKKNESFTKVSVIETPKQLNSNIFLR